MKNTLFYFLLFSIVVACTSSAKDKTTKKPPNIVFLFADDMTYQAINALGNKEINTPHLDKLVQNGTTFTHAYNMGGWNGAVCVASRSMLVSGKSVWRAKQFMKDWSEGDTSLVDQTWGALLKKQGYDTYMTGKWHVKIPAEKVFQQVVHTRPGMPKDMGYFKPLNKWIKGGKKEKWATIMPPGYNRPLSKEDASWSPSDTKFGGFWKGGKHWSEVLKDDALGFINQASQKDNPFFMYLAFNAPHDPRQAPASYVAQYPLDNISLPSNWQAEYADQDSIGNGRLLRDEALAPFPRTEYATKVHIQEYYAIITHLDEQIGQIVRALEQQNQLENTYIFFTADHGLAVGQHGLLGKQNMYDHSVRVPLIVNGPDIPANNRVGAAVYLQDILPSSLELAGSNSFAATEFHSLLDLAKGQQTDSHYDAIYGCYIDWQRMIKKDGFKLIAYPKLKKLLLFDMTTDPYERKNLAGEAAYQAKVEFLFKELVRLQEAMGDELNLEEVYSSIGEAVTF